MTSPSADRPSRPASPARRAALSAAPALVALATFAPALLGSGPAQAAEPFPSRPIRFVVPFATGGPTDIMARVLAAKLAESLKQPVVVENRTGAGGMLGAGQVAKAPADGYTVLVASSSTHAIAPALTRTMPYDPVRDFVPLALFNTGPFLVVVNAQLPARSIAELAALARERPGQLAYGSSGNGGQLHLGGELFQVLTGTRLNHVPYRGAAPAVVDLASGQVQLMFDSVPNALPNVRAGRTRALAVMGPRRIDVLPDVPTAAEAGVAGLEVPSWVGIFVPAGTPREAELALKGALRSALAAPDVRERAAATGMEVDVVEEAALAATVERDLKRVQDLVEKAKIEKQ